MGRWALPRGMQRRGKAAVPGGVGLGGLGWARQAEPACQGMVEGQAGSACFQADS